MACHDEGGKGTAPVDDTAPYDVVDPFAGTFATSHVRAVSVTAGTRSCFAPAVEDTVGLDPQAGYLDGGGSACEGVDSGEQIGPWVEGGPGPLRVKDHSESDLQVDPTDPDHLIGFSKWFVNGEAYLFLEGFFESFDGGETWPVQGHVPGYEAWVINSDPVGAFDPWGNFYAVMLANACRSAEDIDPECMDATGPGEQRGAIAVAVRPAGARDVGDWIVARADGQVDTVVTSDAPTPLPLDKPWVAIDRTGGEHHGRVYVTWVSPANGSTEVA